MTISRFRHLGRRFALRDIAQHKIVFGGITKRRGENPVSVDDCSRSESTLAVSTDAALGA
jgi:hypothetical protein